MFRLSVLLPAVLVLMGCSNIERQERTHHHTEVSVPSSQKSEEHAQTSEPAKGSGSLEFKVAVFGDSSHGISFASVLHTIKNQGAEFALQLGDLAYFGTPKNWITQPRSILGESFPFIFLPGNHDIGDWDKVDGYAQLWREQVAASQLQCTTVPGQEGAKSTCHFKDLAVVMSGAGTRDTGHDTYIRGALGSFGDVPWKLCGWHKNQADMQVGLKGDEVGWTPYQICGEHGAIIVTGHEHSYARTRTLTRLGERTQSHGAIGPMDHVTLGSKSTFVAVIGTGGQSLRPYNCLLPGVAPWWASFYTSNYIVKNGNEVFPKNCHIGTVYDPNEYGVLFLTFNFGGDPLIAKGEFITTKGRVLDEFLIHRS